MKERQLICQHLSRTGGCLNSSPSTLRAETPDILNQPTSCKAADNPIMQKKCSGYVEKDIQSPILPTQKPGLFG